MEFRCVMERDDDRVESWTGKLTLIDWCEEGHFEFAITGRGTYFHVIAGPQINGYYLCLPGLGLGSELASFTDILWNTERLSRLMRPVDAVTLATGLREFGELFQAEELM